MNKKFNRRDFIKGASLLPLCAAGIGLGTVSAMAIEPIKRAGGSTLKVSCNAYSFAKLLNDQLLGRGAGISLFDLADFCAKQNFDGFDVTGYYLPGYEKNGPGVWTEIPNLLRHRQHHALQPLILDVDCPHDSPRKLPPLRCIKLGLQYHRRLESHLFGLRLHRFKKLQQFIRRHRGWRGKREMIAQTHANSMRNRSRIINNNLGLF